MLKEERGLSLKQTIKELVLMKKLKFVKIKCQCGHVNLIPVTEVFHVYENIRCEKCGKVMAEPKELTRIGS